MGTHRTKSVALSLKRILNVEKLGFNDAPSRLAYLIDRIKDDPPWYTHVLNLTLDRFMHERWGQGKPLMTQEQAQQIQELAASKIPEPETV